MQTEQITGYAAALFEVARAEGALGVVENELFDLSHVLSSSDELRSTLTDARHRLSGTSSNSCSSTIWSNRPSRS